MRSIISVAAGIRHRTLIGMLAALVIICCSTASGRPDPRGAITSAKALRSMARVYMAAGRYDTAREYANRAIAAAVNASEPDTLTSACVIDLAWADLQLGSFDSALELGYRALDLQKKAYGDKHIYVAYTLRILSSINYEKGDYRQARLLLDESIEVMHANAAGENEIAPFLVDLAGILVAQGRYEEAEQTYLTAEDKVLASFGPSHLYTANVMTRIAALYIHEGRFDEAAILVDEAYPVLKEIFGNDSYALVDVWMTMAALFEHSGEMMKAENMMKRALARVEKQYGSDHPKAARILSSLGEFYLDNGDYVNAALVCPAAAQKLMTSFGQAHDATALAQNDLARLYAWEGRTIEASRLCSDAVTTLMQLFDPDHPALAKVRNTISSLLLAKAPDTTSNIN